MSDDLVKRLRSEITINPDVKLLPPVIQKQAADRIEELEAKLAKAMGHFKKLHRRQDSLETFDAVVNEIVETALAELKRREVMSDLTCTNCGEYVGSPIADRISELEAKLAVAVDGLKECVNEIDAYIQFEYPSDHPVHERYRQRDYAANPARVAISELKGQNNGNG